VEEGQEAYAWNENPSSLSHEARTEGVGLHGMGSSSSLSASEAATTCPYMGLII
jgi:hypothetical protein